MPQPQQPRLVGVVKTLFDPRRTTTEEKTTGEGTVLRFELPGDHEFWAEVFLSEAWLAHKLAEVRAGRPANPEVPAPRSVADESARAQRVAAASMPAWSPGREFA